MGKIKFLAGAALFVLGVFGGNALYQWLSEHSEGHLAAQDMVTRHRPDFSLPDLDGKIRNIAEWDGKVTVLNFWATWCPPCKREIPTFIQLQEQYASKGVQFVGVAIDTPDKVIPYTDGARVNYPTLIGEQNAVSISHAFGNRLDALPYTVVIDRRGTIAFVHRGEVTREMAEQTILPLL